VVAWRQLRDLGYTKSAVSRLVARGYLMPLYPAVYAVGHQPLRVEGRLVAALFHAGIGSALSHTTAAWWWRLTDAQPTTIHIATPHRPTGARGLRLHRRPQVDRVLERRLPVTPVSRTLLDLSAIVDQRTLRLAMAQADHRNLLDADAVHAELGPGRRGARALRRALARHLPELAATDSELEVAFLLLVERAGLPIPRVNVRIEGLKVDALWPEQRLIVELDGHATHANPVANEEDRRRELILRSAGYRIVRYTWQQIHRRPDEVVADLRRALAVPAAHAE
jgi:very-short-patch-repair endonuclease